MHTGSTFCGYEALIRVPDEVLKTQQHNVVAQLWTLAYYCSWIVEHHAGIQQANAQYDVGARGASDMQKLTNVLRRVVDETTIPIALKKARMRHSPRMHKKLPLAHASEHRSRKSPLVGETRGQSQDSPRVGRRANGTQGLYGRISSTCCSEECDGTQFFYWINR